MSAVESLALVLLDMVVAVLALGGGQAEGFHLRLELLDATDTGQVAVQLGGHVAGLQKLGIKIQRGCQVLVALQSVLLVITKRKKEIFKTMLKKFCEGNLRFGSKEVVLRRNLRCDDLRSPSLLFFQLRCLCHLPLLIVVEQNQGGILPLDGRGQAIFVVVPEQIQQLLEADHRGIVVDFQDLRVIAPVEIA